MGPALYNAYIEWTYRTSSLQYLTSLKLSPFCLSVWCTTCDHTLLNWTHIFMWYTTSDTVDNGHLKTWLLHDNIQLVVRVVLLPINPYKVYTHAPNVFLLHSQSVECHHFHQLIVGCLMVVIHTHYPIWWGWTKSVCGKLVKMILNFLPLRDQCHLKNHGSLKCQSAINSQCKLPSIS